MLRLSPRFSSSIFQDLDSFGKCHPRGSQLSRALCFSTLLIQCGRFYQSVLLSRRTMSLISTRFSGIKVNQIYLNWRKSKQAHSLYKYWYLAFNSTLMIHLRKGNSIKSGKCDYRKKCFWSIWLFPGLWVNEKSISEIKMLNIDCDYHYKYCLGLVLSFSFLSCTTAFLQSFGTLIKE